MAREADDRGQRPPVVLEHRALRRWLSNAPLPEPHLLGIAAGAWLNRKRPWLLDIFPDYLDGRPTNGMGYFELTGTRRVWAEPGLGVIDFDEVVAAMPDAYRGDYMIEVDVPSVDSRYESHRMSYEWAKSA